MAEHSRRVFVGRSLIGVAAGALLIGDAGAEVAAAVEELAEARATR